MIYPAFGTLMLLAVYLNRQDRKMLALALVVSAGFFMPIPKHDWLTFYVCAIGTEMCVAVLAWRIQCAATRPIMVVSVLLIACHIAGAIRDGSPALSQYRILVPIFEVAEPAILILFSKYFSGFLHNHESPPI